MKPSAVLWLAAALAAAGCSNRPAATQAELQPSQVAQAQPAPATPAPPPSDDPRDDAAAPVAGTREAPPPVERVVIPRGTAIRVRLEHGVSTVSNRPGDRFTATLDAPILHGAHVAIPKGTVFTGHLTAAKPSGRLRGRAYLGLTLDSFELHGRRYRIATSGSGRSSASHQRRNAGIIGGGTGFGGLLGAIAGGGKGALIGLGAGAVAGTAGAAITGRRNVRLPAETLLSFSLERPVTL
jgi:hypothetical protein